MRDRRSSLRCIDPAWSRLQRRSADEVTKISSLKVDYIISESRNFSLPWWLIFLSPFNLGVRVAALLCRGFGGTLSRRWLSRGWCWHHSSAQRGCGRRPVHLEGLRRLLVGLFWGSVCEQLWPPRCAHLSISGHMKCPNVEESIGPIWGSKMCHFGRALCHFVGEYFWGGESSWAAKWSHPKTKARTCSENDLPLDEF